MNDSGQNEHLYILSPVWVPKWLRSEVSSLNDLSHSWHLWMRFCIWNFWMCWLRAPMFGEVLSQCGHFCGSDEWLSICVLSVYRVVSQALQISHWIFGFLSWTLRTCATTSLFVRKVLAQNSQISSLKSDGFKWIRVSCDSRSVAFENLEMKQKINVTNDAFV